MYVCACIFFFIYIYISWFSSCINVHLVYIICVSMVSSDGAILPDILVSGVCLCVIVLASLLFSVLEPLLLTNAFYARLK